MTVKPEQKNRIYLGDVCLKINLIHTFFWNFENLVYALILEKPN